MPASSNARRTDSTLAGVLRPGPSGPSIRLIVGNDSLDASASFGWLQSSSARAARICAVVRLRDNFHL